MFSLLYNAPLFALTCFWIFCRLRENRRWLSFTSAVDIVVVMMAASRYFGSSIPPSGHALFLTHTMITVNNRIYQTFAVMMLILTVALKVSWGDYRSWAYGILIGLISGGVWVWAQRQMQKAQPAVAPSIESETR